MNRICFDYEDGQTTGGFPIIKRQCYCKTTACTNFKNSKSEICKTCVNKDCDYSTVGCPWYVNEDHLNWVLEELKNPKRLTRSQS